jgi:replication factor C subunit 3/5
MTTTTDVPWVEKYRPINFDSIVLESTNKQLLQNIIRKNTFPNLLLYGPPGTGKTTTIINLINRYQEVNNYTHKKGYTIHLNASDDRGIDIIRNQIKTFVRTNNFYGEKCKFVILDEVDYMTKNAQQALKYLIQTNNNNVRFCLICNYISRIEPSLKNEFVRLRFCQLPREEIILFLKNIIEKEKITWSKENLDNLLNLFKSDIRSMINYLQSNHQLVDDDVHVLKLQIIATIVNEYIFTEVKLPKVITFINDISIKYNTEIKTMIKEIISYIINMKTEEPEKKNKIINICEFIIHNIKISQKNLLSFLIFEVRKINNSFK